MSKIVYRLVMLILAVFLPLCMGSTYELIITGNLNGVLIGTGLSAAVWFTVLLVQYLSLPETQI